VNGRGKSVRITEYAFGEAGSVVRDVGLKNIARDRRGELIPLDDSWIKSAVYVVKPPTASTDTGDRLFFSRVRFEPGGEQLFEAQETVRRIRIEFRYFGPSDDGWAEQGYTSCAIDLAVQHGLEPNASSLRSLYKRLVGEVVTNPERARRVFAVEYTRELVRRWMQSQVIPGYIFEARSAGNRPIDAAVIFSGAPDYSLLLRGVRRENDLLERLEVRRPAASFAKCGSEIEE